MSRLKECPALSHGIHAHRGHALDKELKYSEWGKDVEILHRLKKKSLCAI